MKVLEITTGRGGQFIDITSSVKGLVRDSGVGLGLAHVFVPHTTAAVTVNENADPSVVEDIIDGLEKLAPGNARYRHLEGNADAHIKATLVGSSVTVPVSGGELQLGTWQGIFFCEFDGPRQRQVWVSLLGGNNEVNSACLISEPL